MIQMPPPPLWPVCWRLLLLRAPEQSLPGFLGTLPLAGSVAATWHYPMCFYVQISLFL